MADQYLNPHKETHTHAIVSSNNKHHQRRPAKGASQSYYLYFGVYRSRYIFPNYDTTRVYKAKTTSTVDLFFFSVFLRGIGIETTQPLRTAVALLHGIHVRIVRESKKEEKIKRFLVNVKL